MRNKNVVGLLPAGERAHTKAAAAQFASSVLPFILPLKAQGASLRRIAEALNERGIGMPTFRPGASWSVLVQGSTLMQASAQDAAHLNPPANP